MVSVLGITVSDDKPALCFFFCSGGIFFFYLIHSYTMEWLKNEKILHISWFVTLLQCTLYSIFGAVDRQIRNAPPRKATMGDYMKIGFLQVATLSLSNYSAQYLNIPTQMLFKSSKLIPVMAVNEIYFRRRGGFGEYLAALLLVAGLVLFTLEDSKLSPEFNYVGVLIVSGALLADSLIGSVQEEILKNRGTTSCEMVMYSHIMGGIYVLLLAVGTGQLEQGITKCLASFELCLYLTLYAVVGFVGISFVMAMIRRFGCVIAVTVTSTRKALSIMLSFILFPKPLSINYAIAFFVFSLGIAADVIVKNASAKLYTRKLWQAVVESWLGGSIQPLADWWAREGCSCFGKKEKPGGVDTVAKDEEALLGGGGEGVDVEMGGVKGEGGVQGRLEFDALGSRQRGITSDGPLIGKPE